LLVKGDANLSVRAQRPYAMYGRFGRAAEGGEIYLIDNLFQKL